MQYVKKVSKDDINVDMIEKNAAVIGITDSDDLCVFNKDGVTTYTKDAPTDGKAYVRKDSSWVALPDSTVDTYMYYGYVDQAGVDSVDEITNIVITAAVSSGTMVYEKTVLNTDLYIANIPAGSFLVVLVPTSFVAMLNNAGTPVQFDPDRVIGVKGAAGIEVTINGTSYALYCEPCITAASAAIQVREVKDEQ
jgi:hypothetical protein